MASSTRSAALAATLTTLLLAGMPLGCGGGGNTDGDAGLGDALGPDAAIDGGMVSCQPSASVSGSPDELDGTLDGAEPDLNVTAGSCSDVIAPFGVQALGPDQVIAVSRLAPEVDYAVRLVSANDLAFYVAAGCSDAPKAVNECMLYVDSTTGNIEVGRFTAPANGEVVVVVDHWEAEAPSDGSYSMELYEVECDDTDASACAGSTPVCVDFRCASCDTSFDCHNPNLPVCDPVADRCVAGVNGCDSDDDGENNDDGPAGARDLTPSGAAPEVLAGKICNAPPTEYDFYRFDVGQNGESYLLTLSWAEPGVDLDVEILDDTGRSYGLSLFERPETIQLTHLPVGSYYALVNYASTSQVSTPVDYTISATRGAAAPCSSVADCAVEYRNQTFRGSCNAGACEPRAGDGGVTGEAVCDSSPDCQSGYCASFPFTANADTRSVCTAGCSNDTMCEGLGADWVCTNYLAENVCVKKCTADEQCPITFSFLPQSGPWFRLSCEPVSGRCGI